jgi:hypothetical protein
MAAPKEESPNSGPVLDRQMIHLCEEVSKHLSQLNLDWPVLIAIAGVTSRGVVNMNHPIHPGRVRKRQKKAEVLEVIARTCAGQMIAAEKGALFLAKLHGISQKAVAAAYNTFLKEMRSEER